MIQRAFRQTLSRTLVTATLLLLFASPLFAQRGGITIPQNLDELVEESSIIFRGRVLSARWEKHPQLKALNTVVVTLRVEEAWKGQPGSTYTFRQFVWDVRDRYDLAGYQKGQQLVLLLNNPNEHGLSSPIGLEQGRFRILSDPDGSLTVVNGQANASLFSGLNARVKSRGFRLPPRLESLAGGPAQPALPLADLRDFVRELSRGK